MNKKIAGVLLGVLLVSIVSAGLVSYLSNMVTATIEVEGPVFYASCDNFDSSTELYQLLLNNYNPSDDCIKSFIDGTTNLWFISQSLGIESFYPARYDFTMYARTEGGVGGQIVAELWTAEENGDLNYNICSTTIPVPEKEGGDSNFYQYTGSCTGSELSLNNHDRLAWKLSDGFHDVTYYIQINADNTKVEITKA